MTVFQGLAALAILLTIAFALSEDRRAIPPRVVIGGVLLTGGAGSVIGIVIGTLTFAIVNQGIYFTQFDANWSSLIIGILLLLAVLMNNTFRKMALAYAPRKKK